MNRRWLAMPLSILAALAPAAAPAQSPGMGSLPVVGGGALRPEWTVERTSAGRARVVGYLYNDSGTRDALNVWLRVERLAPDGEVGAVYRSRIVGDVLSRDRLAFTVAVPEPVASYRVVVESVEWADECR